MHATVLALYVINSDISKHDTSCSMLKVWDIFLYLHLGAINPDEQYALMTAHREGDFNTKLALHEKYY